MPDMDDLKDFADKHDNKVDEGLEKAGDAAGDKFGNADQINKGVDKLQERTGECDSSR